MRLTLIISALLGAALAQSVCGLVLVRQLSKLLNSPSWKWKGVAWNLLISCELIALGDRIYNGIAGRWIGLVYSGLFLLALAAFTNSYRIMVADLSTLFGRLDRND